jgi:hypothetical protein
MLRLAILSFCIPFAASPCTRMDLTQGNALNFSSFVFEGVVTGIHHFEPEQEQSAHSRTLVTFNVSRIWKGSVGATIQIHVWERATGCELSYTFELGRRYSIYASRTPSEVGWADAYPKRKQILQLVRVVEDTESEAKILGKPRKAISN